MTRLRPGTRLRSQVCSTEIIVVVPPTGDVIVACGGQPMIEIGTEARSAPASALDPSLSGGTLIGKRYIHLATPFEALCTKSGEGSLTMDGESLHVKAATALPVSD